MPTTMHVVSHTHWDREWYQTFQQFRLRLVDLIDHLLDILETDPSFRTFNLDAQTIVLDDYFAIRPQARKRVEKLVRDGRITIGPWYQLNDEYLTSGESTVRSLLIGHRMAREFGPVMKVGYLPDQFGNISQMPQILQGFGIDNAIMGRGRQLVRDRTIEFWWEAPDGSRVLSSLMAWWYNNAQYMPQDAAEAVEFVTAIRNRMAPRAATEHLLLMNGVDHLEAQPHAGRSIEAAAAALEAAGGGDTIRHATLTEYVDAIRAEVAAKEPLLRTVVGELREDRDGSCLAGVLSTRMYLKQANHVAQIALEQYAERLCAYARTLGAAYPQDQLRYAWKLLMQNHPHDSICGCSIDQVHDEMVPRFQQVTQVAGVMADRAIDALTGRDRTQGARADATRVVVFNTLNWTRTDPVTMTLEFPLGAPARSDAQRDDTLAPIGFRLLDPNGAETPFAVVHTETAVGAVYNPHELPLDQWVRRVTIEFVAANVPSCGYAVYSIEPCRAMPRYADYRPSCETWELFGERDPVLEDVGDAGDEYLYRRPLNDARCLFESGHVAEETRCDNAVRVRKVDEFTVELPASADVQGRATERVGCPVRVTTTRWRDVPRIEYHIEVDNRAKDHRLRVCWHAGQISRVVTGGKFDAIERPIHNPLVDEGAAPFGPVDGWIDVDGIDGIEPMAVLVRGLPEYEVYEEASADGQLHDVAITLLRSVGQLSGRGDGPGILTPGGQCLGRHEFDLAIYAHEGDWKQDRVWRQSEQFNAPLVAVQCAAPAALAEAGSFVTTTADALVVTAIKRAEDSDTLIVRVVNMTDERSPGAAITVAGASRIRPVNMNEEAHGRWRSGDTITLDIGAGKIITLEAEM